MLDISKLLEEMKQAPFTEVNITSPWSGLVTFSDIKEGDSVHGPLGTWKEIPGTSLATIERERNPKLLCAPEKGRIKTIHRQFEQCFVEAGTTLLTLQHFLTKDEVLQIILKRALNLFMAPEKAKYYFTPEVDKKIKASGHRSVKVQDGMELFIMSRMKREAVLNYTGPEGLIYAVYFAYNENVDAGLPLIGVCPEEQMAEIEDVVARVHSEWEEQE